MSAQQQLSKPSFRKATKASAKLRLALTGPPGSGKTYTSLNIAKHLGSSIALIDTEKGSASKYADLFEFDVLELESFHPQTYIDAIHAAEAVGFDVLIIDSFSHAWVGKDGALELVDRAKKQKQGGGNDFSAWRDITPLQNSLVEAIVSARLHVIATMRSKTEYVMEQNERGKMVPRKVGLAPVQRDGVEYEFDVIGDLNPDNELIVTKTRCPQLNGAVIKQAGKEVADILSAWLEGVTVITREQMDEIESLWKGLEAAGHFKTRLQMQGDLIDRTGKNSRNALTEVEAHAYIGSLKKLTNEVLDKRAKENEAR
jgi:Cdc6-like AAA superfamily ATPase